MVECRVLDVVDAQDGVERAAFALMREFHGIDIVRNPTRPLSDGENLFLRDVDKFCIGIDKSPDQPGAGNSVDLWVFARHPLARSRPDVTTRGQSLFGTTSNAAFQEVSFDPHQA